MILGLVQQRRRLQGIFNAQAKLDSESYNNLLAIEAQEGIYKNSLHHAFRTIKCLSARGGPAEPTSVKKIDGSACSSSEEILQQWQEHVESALNFTTANVGPKLIAVTSQTTPDVSVVSH